MHTFKSSAMYSIGSLALCLLVGCGESQKLPGFVSDLVPVSGTVTWKGNPLPGATVKFLLPPTATKGEIAEAVTDENGQFEMQTLIAQLDAKDRKGAIPGEYRVVISHFTMADGSPIPPGTTEADAGAEGAKQTLPPQYSDSDASTLTAVVKQQPTEIKFALE